MDFGQIVAPTIKELFIERIEGMILSGALKPGAPRIGLHFSHAAVPPHPELVNRFRGRLVIAYDGMQLEL